MTFQEKLLQFKSIIFDLISTKDITLLCELDKRIHIVKKGKFSYWKSTDTKYGSDLHSTSVYSYLNDLDL